MLCSTKSVRPCCLDVSEVVKLRVEDLHCEASLLSGEDPRAADRPVLRRLKLATSAPPAEQHWFPLVLGSPSFTRPSVKSASSNVTACWPQHMHKVTLLYLYVSHTRTLVFPFWLRRLQREEWDEK